MPMLLEDLAEETSTSNRRIADLLDAEVRRLDELDGAEKALKSLQRSVRGMALVATDFAVSHLPQHEGFMRSALDILRTEPFGESAEACLRTVLKGFRSGQRLIGAVRSFWQTAEQMGVAPARFDELDETEHRLEELVAEAERALEHRTRDWRPADPQRLAAGLQLAREGDTVKADEARAWFRRTPE